MNSLADADMIARLYRASQRGVKVKLCVRGICCLRPGVRGLSQNIEVVSVIDRFLEHSRVYYFKNGGAEEVYLASADFMVRNLDRRLELAFPVRDPSLSARVVQALQTVFSDNQRAWRLKADGGWERVAPKGSEAARRAQAIFMDEALARAEAARIKRLSVFRPQGPGTAPGIGG
jgi:polyphosphate kinase